MAAWIYEFLKKLLKRKGYEVEAISTGAESYEMILAFAPAVILLDVQVQLENGRDICKQIKMNKLTMDIKVILISANHLLLENYRECEADAVIEKPFNNSTVYETVENILLTKSCAV